VLDVDEARVGVDEGLSEDEVLEEVGPDCDGVQVDVVLGVGRFGHGVVDAIDEVGDRLQRRELLEPAAVWLGREVEAPELPVRRVERLPVSSGASSSSLITGRGSRHKNGSGERPTRTRGRAAA
jgi:hypothetical protein